MIINTERNTTEPSPALTLNLDEERFKSYLMDAHFLINLSFRDGSYLNNEFYHTILTDYLHINEGMFIENIVAQCLRTNGHRIAFYVSYNERNELTLEIDFLIRFDRNCIPIEVQSSTEYARKSLKKFKKSFSIKYACDMYCLKET